MTDAIVSPRGFSHVRLTVTDIHRSKAFYQQLSNSPRRTPTAGRSVRT